MPRPPAPLVDTFGRVHRDLRDLAHRPLLAALHVLHARAGQRVARPLEHPDPRRDRAGRAGRRRGGRHDVPAHRRRAAAAHRHRRCRPAARRDHGPGRRAGRAGDDHERHPPARAAARTHRGGPGPAQHLARHPAPRSLPRPHPPRSARRRARRDRRGRGIRSPSAQAQRRRDARCQRRRARSTSCSSPSTTMPRCASSSRCRSTRGTRGIARGWSRATRSSTRCRRAGRSPRCPAAAALRPSAGRSTADRTTVGVIASVTAPFCGDCDRLRLTADGQLRNCLFSTTEFDLLPVLRGRREPTTSIDGDRSDAALLRARQAPRSRDQRPGVPPARARDERDRRLSPGRSCRGLP